MRDFHLRFFIEKRWPDGMVNIIYDDETNLRIPQNGGAYIIGSSDRTMFIYPWGSSPIFYIGQSSNLSKRINEHKKYILKAINDHEEEYWWPRYQFAASFGADVAWYSIRGNQNPNTLESDLITTFYEVYGAIPHANGTWPSGLRPKHGARDDK